MFQSRPGDIHHGPGCSYISREPTVAIVCPRDGVSAVEARLGGGGDTINVEVTSEGLEVGSALTLAMPVRVLAGDGDDVLTASAFMGRGQPVALDGGPGQDTLRINDVTGTASGGPGDDDFIYATSKDGPGAVGDGGDGDDRLIASSIDSDGPDTLNGGPGTDFVNARNALSRTDRPGARDRVDCGAGTDIVFADRSDDVTGCEIELRSIGASEVAAAFFDAVRRTHRTGAARLAAGRPVKTHLEAPAGSRLKLALRVGGTVVARATGHPGQALRLTATAAGRRFLRQRNPTAGTLTLIRTGEGAVRWTLGVGLG